MKIVDLKYRTINNMKVDGIIKIFNNIKFEKFLSILNVLAIPKY